MQIIFLLLFTSCSLFFSAKDRPETAKGELYEINFKAPGWNKVKDERSDYVFENTEGNVLLSNSFCNEFQDQSLDTLATKTFKTLSDFNIHEKRFLDFHGREAFHLTGMGQVDGVKVNLQILNTRRDNCYFDFVAISPVEKKEESKKLFSHFLNTVTFK